MDIDWAFAGKIGGVGFGLVFVVLVVLAVAIWLTGSVVRRLTADKEEAGEKKKGA
jgi:Na+-transporting methylmalonyl-CoA/oxaloacetate decarboxylase gamma subunit